MRRIEFFSIYDGASGRMLNLMEERFEQLNNKAELDINDILELYHAKLYIDNGIFLNRWDEMKRRELIDSAKCNWDKIKSHILEISSESFLSIYENLEFRYKGSFWEIVDNIDYYKKISNECVSKILQSNPNEIKQILHRERLVKYFSAIVREYLLNHSLTAELILAEEDQSKDQAKYFFPKALSTLERECIISSYLDLENANLNYVNLALLAKDSPSLKLSDKTRLKAKRVYKKLSDKFLSGDLSSIQTYGIEVGVKRDQFEPVVFRREDNTFKADYSWDYLISLLKGDQFITIFKFLFQFTDEHGLINLVSKESELSTLEKIFMHSKNEYATGLEFSRRNMLSLAQIALVNRLLDEDSRNIFDLMDSLVKRLHFFGIELEKLTLNKPSSGLTDEERIKVLAPSLESFLNQYSHYVREGEIDFELLGISSRPSSFGSIGSKVQNKYVYVKDNSKLEELFNILFSDQSILLLSERFDNNHENFCDILLEGKPLKYNDFEKFQKSTIDRLIADELVFFDDNGNLSIRNESQLSIMSSFYRNRVISYWHFSPILRQELDAMILKGWCYSESTLFTKFETTYLNFYLNKKEFTDGPDLRNKYLHGTNSNGVESNFDYLMYLRIVILCLLKIEDDLILFRVQS